MTENSTITKRILFIGCGRMGGALFKGMAARCETPSEQLAVMDMNTDILHSLKSEYHVATGTSWEDEAIANFKPDAILLAVKPNGLGQTLDDIKTRFSTQLLCLSVAAGKTIPFMEQHLGADYPIARTMPNLPAMIGMGATAICSNAAVTSEHKSLIKAMFDSVGKAFLLDDESQMDAVTAISGSGPAYLFHFAECLAKAGASLDLPEELAKDLAYATIKGSAEILGTQGDATTLREQVTSPNGTTQAGLEALMQGDALQKLVNATTEAACKRSKELAQ